jgi:outer membrane translocation and assembly module TamA
MAKENIVQFQFKPGQSGNPSGRRKKLPITKEYEKLMGEKLSKTKPGEKIRVEYGLSTRATWARAVAIGIAIEAANGKGSGFAREMREATEGKSLQRIREVDDQTDASQVRDQTIDELRDDVMALLDRARSRTANTGRTDRGEGQAS